MRQAEAGVELAENPTGIAPERALVFETAGNIQNFARAARAVDLEVIAEIDLDDDADISDGFTPPRGQATLSRALYAHHAYHPFGKPDSCTLACPSGRGGCT